MPTWTQSKPQFESESGLPSNPAADTWQSFNVMPTKSSSEGAFIYVTGVSFYDQSTPNWSVTYLAYEDGQYLEGGTIEFIQTSDYKAWLDTWGNNGYFATITSGEYTDAVTLISGYIP